ncbi:IS30 family transposase [Nocardia fusca]|uniref:IS30 family transposase n=1 Tax=Nocardia fusca TaxID=941183 RepID=UPI00378C3007
MRDHHPADVESRAVPGHWEGDLIVGARNGSAIAELVDRRSRFVRLVHLPDGRNAGAFVAAALGMLTTVPAQVRLTSTWDQGSEMARHDLLADLFAEGIYFAHPGPPWTRATNENTNGLRASTSRRLPICPCTASRTSGRPRNESIPDRAESLAGKRPRKSSKPNRQDEILSRVAAMTRKRLEPKRTGWAKVQPTLTPPPPRLG